MNSYLKVVCGKVIMDYFVKHFHAFIKISYIGKLNIQLIIFM